MENINYELIGAIFISIMAVRFAWDFMLWVEKWIDKFYIIRKALNLRDEILKEKASK